MVTSNLQIFGIRHHGPGSARSLRRALEALQPDIVLVEGPPDAGEMLPLLLHPEMQPPVALLVYNPDLLRQAVYYPFARFSPEWQALDYALRREIPARFIDLPIARQLPLAEAEEPPAEMSDAVAEDESAENPRQDPLRYLAIAAGYSDSERWWEHMVETRRDDVGMFEGIQEAMTALREEIELPADRREDLREAWMRQEIRTAQREGFQRIAIVCGAWHAPALADPAGRRKDDTALLKGLAKCKTQATWIPWTYGRLAFASGYGAGIESPGWYEHLWEARSAGRPPRELAIRWLTRVAHLLRAEDLDASSAHVIEALRLAEALAVLRERPLPGLPELNEAARAVFCFNSDLPMRLIQERLIISDRLGEVPADTPAVPLQQDLQREQRRLKLKPGADWREQRLDLRETINRERSALLRRLALLGIPWGQLQPDQRGSGTFWETWRLEWQPEFALKLIEAGVWGQTIATAAAACAHDLAENAPDLPALVGVVNQVLLADLPDAIGELMARLEDRAALAGDVEQLIDALIWEDPVTRSSLVNSLRYGNVRGTDGNLVAHVIEGLVIRICIGLPGACAGLDDEAAETMFGRLVGMERAIGLLQNAEHRERWLATLQRLADLQGIHGLLAGRCCRILLDSGMLDSSEIGRRLSLALSAAAEPAQAAAWIEGLLRDSGALLLHDQVLWYLIDDWLSGLRDEQFILVLPLLRRTFASFEAAERRQMGEHVHRADVSISPSISATIPATLDEERAAAVLPTVASMLGIDYPAERR
jgi:hypothetical protein